MVCLATIDSDGDEVYSITWNIDENSSTSKKDEKYDKFDDKYESRRSRTR